MEHCLVITTVADQESAERIAGRLLEEKAAACVSVLPGALSYYQWKGHVARDEELVLLIKSRTDSYPRLEALILAEHPYELPEVIALPIERGLAGYLAWVDGEVRH